MTESRVNNVPRMRTCKEAAEITGLHEFHIRQLVKQNKIVYVTAGRKILVNLDKLIDFLNQGEGA